MQRYKKFLSVYSIRVPPRVTQEPEKRKPNFFCQSIKKTGWRTRIFLGFSMGSLDSYILTLHRVLYIYSLSLYHITYILPHLALAARHVAQEWKWIIFERWLKTSLNPYTAHRPYKWTAHRKIYTFIFILCTIYEKVYYICLSNGDITSSSK